MSNIMQIGVVSRFDEFSQTGEITTPNSSRHQFLFSNGQSMMIDESHLCPRLSGKHLQGRGYHLKLPKVGDAVVFELLSGSDLRWGYADHFNYLLNLHHDNGFRPAASEPQST